jgi:methyl-accepting chemotaxis protein
MCNPNHEIECQVKSLTIIDKQAQRVADHLVELSKDIENGTATTDHTQYSVGRAIAYVNDIRAFASSYAQSVQKMSERDQQFQKRLEEGAYHV